jgi:hypothetical protein
VATLLSCAANIYLATGEYRYWSPIFIFVVALASHHLARKLSLLDSSSSQSRKPFLGLFLISLVTIAISVSSVIFYSQSDGALHASSPVADVYPTSTVTGSIDCYGPYLRIYLTQNGSKRAALDGTAMAANPGMSNSLGGVAHGLTYEGLQNFLAKCVSVNGS